MWKGLLVLHDPYPTGLASRARTKENVVLVGEPDFNWKMNPQPIGVFELTSYPIANLVQTLGSLLVRDSPFGGMLFELN
jgi:hypothetical protein